MKTFIFGILIFTFSIIAVLAMMLVSILLIYGIGLLMGMGFFMVISPPTTVIAGFYVEQLFALAFTFAVLCGACASANRSAISKNNQVNFNNT